MTWTWVVRMRHLAQRKVNFWLKILLVITALIAAGMIHRNGDYCVSSPFWSGTSLTFIRCEQVNEIRGVPGKSITTTTSRPPQRNTFPSHFKIVLSRQPYYNDRDCQNFTINLYQPRTFELTALASYPGSGNTWLRHLIEFATGIFTGSVYFDEELYGRGFFGEKEPWYSGSTVVQKLHVKYSSEYAFPKGILLLREPYEAIVSFVQYLEAGHLGSASPSTFKHEKWKSYVMGQTYSWITLAQSWIQSSAKLLVVHYEHVKEDARRELERICSFLQVPCRHLNHSCLLRHMDGHFHRRKLLRPVVKFEHWVHQRIDDGIDYLSRLLAKTGHAEVPVNLYKYYRGKHGVTETLETASDIGNANDCVWRNNGLADCVWLVGCLLSVLVKQFNMPGEGQTEPNILFHQLGGLDAEKIMHGPD